MRRTKERNLTTTTKNTKKTGRADEFTIQVPRDCSYRRSEHLKRSFIPFDRRNDRQNIAGSKKAAKKSVPNERRICIIIIHL